MHHQDRKQREYGTGSDVNSLFRYSIIFALFIYFFFDIPSSLGVKVFGVPLGEKGIMYLLGLQLAFSSMPLWSSVTASCIGLLCGCLHRSTRLPFHRLRLPRSLTRLFAPFLQLFSRPTVSPGQLHLRPVLTLSTAPRWTTTASGPKPR